MMEYQTNNPELAGFSPWNKGRMVGQKRALKLKEVWAIRARLEIQKNIKELALFNLAIDSKLRGCDLVSLHVSDIARGHQILNRATKIQQKAGKPVIFEITKPTRKALTNLFAETNLAPEDFIFKSRLKNSLHLSTRQYGMIVKK